MTSSIKATVEPGVLAKALKRIVRIVPSRSTIPILAHVRIVCADGHLALSVTDLDKQATLRVPAEIVSEGAFTVEAARFAQIAAAAGASATLIMECDGSAVTLRAGRSRFKLHTLPAEDFPDLDAGELSHHFALPAAGLRLLVARTALAMSDEETRYYLRGIYLHASKDVLIAVATTGHVLAKTELPLPAGAAGMPGVIIPRELIQILTNLFDGDADVGIELSHVRARLTCGDLTLVAKLVDGTFPDYSRVIPHGNPYQARIDRKALIEAIGHVALVQSQRGRGVRLAFAPDAIEISMNNPDAGEASEALEIDFTGDALEIGANNAYALDVLKAIASDAVTLRLADPGSPILIEPDDCAERSLFVVMPLRV